MFCWACRSTPPSWWRARFVQVQENKLCESFPYVEQLFLGLPSIHSEVLADQQVLLLPNVHWVAQPRGKQTGALATWPVLLLTFARAAAATHHHHRRAGGGGLHRAAA